MEIENQFRNTINKIANKKEKILVALSGGKDSCVLACLLKKFGYNIEGIYIDLRIGDYSKKCLDIVKKLCEELEIKLYVYDIKKETRKTLFQIIRKNKKKKLSNCTICGVFKKWILNKKARELNADKIATGHHLDDEIQTFMMNIFKGSPELSANFGPILKSKDSKFIVKIKPLFFIREKEIEDYAEKNNLSVVKKICPYRSETYRIETRRFLNEFSEQDKKNLMKNFIKLSEKIKKEKDSKANYCKLCGEPSRKDICKMCELVKS